MRPTSKTNRPPRPGKFLRAKLKPKSADCERPTAVLTEKPSRVRRHPSAGYKITPGSLAGQDAKLPPRAKGTAVGILATFVFLTFDYTRGMHTAHTQTQATLEATTRVQKD